MRPDESNIVDGSSLDEDWAKRKWLGKSLDEALAMFSTSWNHCHTEDFMYLSDLAVRYYLPAAITYVESEQSKGDYLFAGGMAMSLAGRIKRGELRPETVTIAVQFANTVLSDLSKYCIERDSPNDDLWLDVLDYLAANTQTPDHNDTI